MTLLIIPHKNLYSTSESMNSTCDIFMVIYNTKQRKVNKRYSFSFVIAKSLNFSYAQNRFWLYTKPVSVRPKTGFGYTQNRFWLSPKPVLVKPQTGIGYLKTTITNIYRFRGYGRKGILMHARVPFIYILFVEVSDYSI